MSPPSLFRYTPSDQRRSFQAAFQAKLPKTAPMIQGRPTTDDWLRFGAGLAGVAVAAWIFFTADDPVAGDIGLIAGIGGGEIAGRLLVCLRRHWME